MCCSAALTSWGAMPPKVSMNSSAVMPLPTLWKRADKGTRPSLKHQAPLILCGSRQIPGHAFQSIPPGQCLPALLALITMVSFGFGFSFTVVFHCFRALPLQ